MNIPAIFRKKEKTTQGCVVAIHASDKELSTLKEKREKVLLRMLSEDNPNEDEVKKIDFQIELIQMAKRELQKELEELLRLELLEKVASSGQKIKDIEIEEDEAAKGAGEILGSALKILEPFRGYAPWSVGVINGLITLVSEFESYADRHKSIPIFCAAFQSQIISTSSEIRNYKEEMDNLRRFAEIARDEESILRKVKIQAERMLQPDSVLS